MRQTVSRSITLLAAMALPALAAEWKPIDPLELSLTKGRIDPDAGAEALLWEVRLEDKNQGVDVQTIWNHYVRVKIYNEKGRDDQGTVELPSSKKRFVLEIAARTIKKNGTIVDLKKDQIFERELVKIKGLKVKGKAFALPNVEPGDVVEYQYKEVWQDELANYVPLYFQRDIPVWNVKYTIKPLSIPGFNFSMRWMPFHCNNTPFKNERNGFVSTMMNDVPAFKREPMMPPENEVKSWVLVYYEEDKKMTPEKYWKDLGKALYPGFKDAIKPDGEIKKLAAELVSSSPNPEEQLAAIETFCRTKIKNASYQGFSMTAEEREEVYKKNKKLSDVLKRKAGTSGEINELFASLATAAGFEARRARVGDRGNTFFDPRRMTSHFMRATNVAIKMGDLWKFFDPATPYLEPGMLRWGEEGVPALISDAKEGFFVNTPYSGPEKSAKRRIGRFTLKDDGTLEGTVRAQYEGHSGREFKNQYDDKTEAERELDWTEDVKKLFPDAQITNFHMGNVMEPVKPFAVSYTISIPGYAARTGKRILLQPAVFERGYGARFPETERRHDIYFQYAWSEEDDVRIELPESWELDNPTKAPDTSFGEMGGYKTDLRKTTDGRTILYKRLLTFGAKQMTVIPVSAYPQIRKVFDFIHEQDNHVLTLKQAQ